jgi:hypothetical protein
MFIRLFNCADYVVQIMYRQMRNDNMKIIIQLVKASGWPIIADTEEKQVKLSSG